MKGIPTLSALLLSSSVAFAAPTSLLPIYCDKGHIIKHGVDIGTSITGPSGAIWFCSPDDHITTTVLREI